MIALGSDQAGYELKQEIIKYLEEKGLEYMDFGSYNADPVDYPVYGKLVANAGAPEGGSDCFSAEATRLHNDANILAFGARVVGAGLAVKIVDTFLNTEFSGAERHARRVAMLEE